MLRPVDLPRKLRHHLTSAHLIACAALFVALGGSAFAVSQIPRNSVGPAQLKRGAVKAQHISRAAVKRSRIAPRAINNTRIAARAVNSAKIANGSVNRNKIRPGAVDASRLAPSAVGPAALQPGAVGSASLAAGAVDTGQLANNSVNRAKLTKGSLPLLAPLRSGQTLRGMVAISANGHEAGGSPVIGTDAQSFQFPMFNAPALHVIDATGHAPAPTAECPGIAGGNLQTPQAAPGHLCIYLRTTEGSGPGGGGPLLTPAGRADLAVTRLGFGLAATFISEGGRVVGQWAATAG